jgi:HAD superfamily hydrolase (TIGR01548 family)
MSEVRNMKKRKLIVFDMDGVLIDVSRSYRDTVRQTTKLFFSSAKSSEKLPEPLFHLTDLAAVKQSGGLNNDWDLSCLIINLLYSLIEKPIIKENEDPWVRYQETLNRCHVSALADFLKSTERPLTTLLQQIGKKDDPFINGLFVGDVGSGNIIKQIFQEIYLGKELFESTYGLPAKLYQGEGFIHREKLLIGKKTLDQLTKNNILAIATGRPKAEVDYPLDYFDLRKYFTVVYALEDCLKEEERILKQEGRAVSLSKPHPFMLDAIANSQKDAVNKFYYIGDMPDDMIAAKRSKVGFIGIGVLLSAADKTSLKKELNTCGADYIVEDFEALMRILRP